MKTEEKATIDPAIYTDMQRVWERLEDRKRDFLPHRSGDTALTSSEIEFCESFLKLSTAIAKDIA